MIKQTKKVAALLISAVIMLVSVSPALAAGVAPVNDRRVDVPTIYVHGYGATIYADANDPNSEKLYNGTQLSDGTLKTLINGIKDPLLKGVKTGKWTEYCDFVVNTLAADLGKFKLDDNGEASNGSGNTCNHDVNVNNRRGSDGKYDIEAYTLLNYDWRLDPFVTADFLNGYIKDIKAKTGFEKVNIVGRCLGSSIVMAYLQKYGCSDVNSVVFYMGLFDGIDVAGALFSGKVSINPDALTRFVERYVPDDDGNMSLIKALVAVVNAVNGLQLPIGVVMKIYDQVYQNIIPRLLLASYGTCPCYWSYVGDKYYDDAKKLMFTGQEEKYAGLIEKIDNYHHNVMLKSDEIIKAVAASGVNVYNIVKYGGDMVPVCDEAAYCNDNVTSVVSQTFGTVSAKIKRPFGTGYIKKAEKNGTLKYISSDNLIDASGDMFKEHTWFIKGIGHANMPSQVEVLMSNILNANGYGSDNYITTEYFEGYPRFLIASEDSWGATFTPMTKENTNDNSPHKSVFEHFSYLFHRLIDFFNELLAKLRGAVGTPKLTA